ncbi:MAG: type II toxin-antitoxin system HicB family antitoxin [Tunicatimonas sp.]
MENTLEHQGFYGIVDYSSEDEVFHGKIIGINDLVIFEGDSVASLKNSFTEAVEDYITLCQEVGKSPLRSFKGSFNVRLTPELHRKAFVSASVSHISLNAFVESAIAEKLKELEQTVS